MLSEVVMQDSAQSTAFAQRGDLFDAGSVVCGREGSSGVVAQPLEYLGRFGAEVVVIPPPREHHAMNRATEHDRYPERGPKPFIWTAAARRPP